VNDVMLYIYPKGSINKFETLDLFSSLPPPVEPAWSRVVLSYVVRMTIELLLIEVQCMSA
jgi:hypothetical protein